MSSTTNPPDPIKSKNNGEQPGATALIDETITSGKNWRPFLQALNDAQISETNERMSLNQFIIEIDGVPKTFVRRKIRTREYNELEDIRARHAEATNPSDKRKLASEQYRKAASFYIGMTEEEFYAADYEEVKRIVDAQNLRTNYGRPNPTISTSSSTTAGQALQ